MRLCTLFHRVEHGPKDLLDLIDRPQLRWASFRGALLELPEKPQLIRGVGDDALGTKGVRLRVSVTSPEVGLEDRAPHMQRTRGIMRSWLPMYRRARGLMEREGTEGSVGR
jgi:hypothetical protein